MLLEVIALAYTQAAYEAAKKYRDKNIKRVPLDMQLTEYAALKMAADAAGEKVNQYIKTAIRQRMEGDAASPTNR